METQGTEFLNHSKYIMSGAGLDEIYRLMDQLDLQNEMEHTIEGIGRAYGEVSLDDLLGVQAPRYNATEMLNREIFSNECEKHAVKFTVTRQRSARCWPRPRGGGGIKTFCS